MRRVFRLIYFFGFLGLLSTSYARLSRSSSTSSVDPGQAPVLVESAPAREQGGLFDRLLGRKVKEEPKVAPPAAAPARPVSAPVLLASSGPSMLLDVNSDGVLVREVPPGGPEGVSRGSITDSRGRRYELYGPRPREKEYVIKGLPSSRRFPPPAPTQVEIAAQKHLGYYGIAGTVIAVLLSLALLKLYSGVRLPSY